MRSDSLSFWGPRVSRPSPAPASAARRFENACSQAWPISAPGRQMPRAILRDPFLGDAAVCADHHSTPVCPVSNRSCTCLRRWHAGLVRSTLACAHALIPSLGGTGEWPHNRPTSRRAVSYDELSSPRPLAPRSSDTTSSCMAAPPRWCFLPSAPISSASPRDQSAPRFLDITATASVARQHSSSRWR